MQGQRNFIAVAALVLAFSAFSFVSASDSIATEVVHGGGNGTVALTAPMYGDGLVIVCRANFTHTITAFNSTLTSVYLWS